MVSPSKRDDIYNIEELRDFNFESDLRKDGFLPYVEMFKKCIQDSNTPKNIEEVSKLKAKLIKYKEMEPKFVEKFINKIEAYLRDVEPHSQHDEASSDSPQSLRSDMSHSPSSNRELASSIHERPVIPSQDFNNREDELRDLQSQYNDLQDPKVSNLLKKEYLLELKKKLPALIGKFQGNESFIERVKKLESQVQVYESEEWAKEVQEIKEEYKELLQKFNNEFKSKKEEMPDYDQVYDLREDVANLLGRINDLRDNQVIGFIGHLQSMLKHCSEFFLFDEPESLAVSKDVSYPPKVIDKVEVMPRSNRSSPEFVKAHFDQCISKIDKLVIAFTNSKTNQDLDEVQNQLKLWESKLRSIDRKMLNEEDQNLLDERLQFFLNTEGFATIYDQIRMKRAKIPKEQVPAQLNEKMLEDRLFYSLKKHDFPEEMPKDYDVMLVDVGPTEEFIVKIKKFCPHWKNLSPDDIRVKMNELLARKKAEEKGKLIIIPSPLFTKTLDMTTSISDLVEKRELIEKQIAKSKWRINDPVKARLTTQVIQLKDEIEKRKALLKTNVANAIATFITDEGSETIQYSQISFLNHSPEQENMAKDQEWVFQSLNGKALIFDGQEGIDQDGNIHMAQKREDCDGATLKVVCQTRYFRFDENDHLKGSERNVTPEEAIRQEVAYGANIGIGDNGSRGKKVRQALSLSKKFL